jgi:type IV pilus assembly protein PilA
MANLIRDWTVSLLLFGALWTVGCAPSHPNAANDDGRGFVSASLDLAPGISVLTASYTIMGPGGFLKTGTIDLSNSSTLTFVVGGLPAGPGYAISVNATSADGGTTCGGAGTFDVTPRTTTGVSLHLACHEAPKSGSVLVNGSLNVCPVIDGVDANPAEVFVGSSLQLRGVAHDADAGPEPLRYTWTATSGVFDNAGSPSPVFTCTEETEVTVTLNVSDGDPSPSCATALGVLIACTNAAKARQSEAKANLKALFTAEKAFFQVKDRYSTFIGEVGFAPERNNRYRYVLTAFPMAIEDRSGLAPVYHVNNNNFEIDEGVDVDTFKWQPLGVTLSQSPCIGSLTWGITNSGSTFTVAAYGNIDNDPTTDMWTISSASRTLSGSGCDDAGSNAAGEPANDVNDVNN